MFLFLITLPYVEVWLYPQMLILLFYSQECLGFISAFLEALKEEAVFALFVRVFLYQSIIF